MASTQNYFNWSMDDIVFEGRNKDYGAYDLRKSEPKNVRIGLYIAFAVIAVLIISSFINWSFLETKKEAVEVNTSVTLKEIPSLENTPPPPPTPPPPQPQRPTVRFVEMVVKKQEEVREEEPMEIPKDEKAEIATKTQEGDENAELTPVITEAPVVEEPKIFTFVEQNPEFPGGDGELIKFLQKNILY